MSEVVAGRGEVPGMPAVVLRTAIVREADLVVILLTPGRGKIDCIARGARRSRKRFPGGLPVGARGEAVLTDGRGSLIPLARFSPAFDHGKVGRDLETFAYVHYLCELTDRLIGGSMPDPTSFALLCEALEACLIQAQAGLLRRFELALLDDLGLLPALRHCAVCGDPALPGDGPGDAGEGEVRFSGERGGVLCLAHGRGTPDMPLAVLALAEVLRSGDPQARAQAYVAADADTRRRLRDLCRSLIQPHLRSPLRSLAFFAQLPRG